MAEEPQGFRDYVAARQRALLGTARMLTGNEQTAEDLPVRYWLAGLAPLPLTYF